MVGGGRVGVVVGGGREGMVVGGGREGVVVGVAQGSRSSCPPRRDSLSRMLEPHTLRRSLLMCVCVCVCVCVCACTISSTVSQ